MVWWVVTMMMTDAAGGVPKRGPCRRCAETVPESRQRGGGTLVPESGNISES